MASSTISSAITGERLGLDMCSLSFGNSLVSTRGMEVAASMILWNPLLMTISKPEGFGSNSTEVPLRTTFSTNPGKIPAIGKCYRSQIRRDCKFLCTLLVMGPGCYQFFP